MQRIVPLLLFLAVFSISCSSAGGNTENNPIAWENIHVIEVSHYPFVIPRTMTVAVTDHEKKPLSDAEVVVTGTDGGFFPTARKVSLKLQGQTDHDGKVVFQFPDEWFEGKITHVWLDVRSAKYTHSRSRLWYEGRHPRPGNAIIVPEELAIEFDGELIAIQVLDEAGQPVTGARIHQGSILEECYPQTSDEQGMLAYGPFTGHQLDNPSHTIQIIHPDFQNQSLTIKRTDLIHPQKTVTLQSGGEIFGAIVDEQGAPVAGAKIYAIGENGLSGRETVTDENGRYRLKGLFPSKQMLLITKEGKQFHFQILARSELAKENNVTLHKAVPIRIRVVNEDGQPLQGIVIKPKYTLTREPFGYEYAQGNILTRGGVPLSERLSNNAHVTDENGCWEWENVPEDIAREIDFQFEPQRALPSPPKGMAYRIVFPLQRFQSREEPYLLTATLYEVEPSPWRLNITTWKDTKSLKVRVLDENLQPLAGALVEPCSGYGDSYGHHIKVDKPFPTNENGIVCFDFSQTDVSDIQDFWIKVSAEGYRETEYFYTEGIVTTAHARTSSKVLPDEVEVILSPVGKLVGQVKDENGKPIEGASITLARGHSAPSTTPVLSDKNGQWIADISNFKLDTDFSTQVRATKGGYLDAMISLRSFPVITMQKAKSISFRVVDGKGQPLEGVQILSMQSSDLPQGPPQGRQTNANGEFRISIAPKDNGTKAELLLQKDGWTPQWVILDLAGKTENLQWSLKPGKDLRVRFSFEGEEKLPVVAEVSAMITQPPTEWGNRLKAKQWQGISQDEGGVILLKDAPDCEALYYFHVPTDGVSMRSGGRGYGATITPNADNQVIQVSVKRNPDER